MHETWHCFLSPVVALKEKQGDFLLASRSLRDIVGYAAFLLTRREVCRNALRATALVIQTTHSQVDDSSR
jgi:hypothetical protein